MYHPNPYRRFFLPWLAGCHLALAACTAPQPRVGYDYDPATDFTAFKQFAWAEPVSPHRSDHPLTDNSLLHERIQSVIEYQLLLKGMPRRNEGAPDFLVSYRIWTQKHVTADPGLSPYGPFYSYGLGFGYARGPWYYDGWGGPMARFEEYETQTLALDFLHPATHKLLWRGVVQDAVDLNSDPVQQRYQLGAKVGYLLQNFPPSPW